MMNHRTHRLHRACRRAVALMVCAVLVVLLYAATVGAASGATGVWSAYAMAENKVGRPYFSDPPTAAYTPDGFCVTPTEETAHYTLQTKQPLSLEDGVYWELRVEQASAGNALVFHVWDQYGLLVDNNRCGSGWYVAIGDYNGTTHLVSMTAAASAATTKEEAGILGVGAVSIPVNDDGSATYTLSYANGVLRINGVAVTGTDKALTFLNSLRDDSCFYFGVTVMTVENDDPLSAVTLTRFGTSAATAVVPTAGSSSSEDTAAADTTATTTRPQDSSVSTNPTDETTDSTVPVTGTGDGDDTSRSPEPDETTVGTLDAESDRVSDGEPSAPLGTDPSRDSDEGTLSEPGEESTEGLLDQFKDLLNQAGATNSCTSAVGTGLFVSLSVMAAVAYAVRKKH